ncbi:MAG: acetylornithine deacetylase [Sulfitobacter sp.]|jgi:acetylornithine deacetylase
MTPTATLEILKDLVGFPTVSADSNLEMISYLAQRLDDTGARVRIMTDESGKKANLFATLGPDRDGGIVLSGHSDVVPAEEPNWSSDPFEMSLREGLIYGRGTCDMKGFIAAAVAMAPEFAEGQLGRPVHFSFTYDEEVGCLGARQLVEDLKHSGIQPAVAIIGEPTEMRIFEGHKGCCEYTTRFRGLEGHGSQPDAGVSAVEYAVRYVARLLELRSDLKQRAPADSRFDPPWTTLQIGRIAGGVAHNVIAGRCDVDWEMRPVTTADKDFIKQAINSYCRETLLPDMQAVFPQASIETEVIGEVEGLEPVSDNEAREIVQALTGANTAEVVAFGTEAGLFQGMGMTAVVCGPGSISQAHKADEFLAVSQLQLAEDMLAKLNASLR